jgi:hypothetical protein
MDYKSFIESHKEVNYKKNNIEDSTFYDKYNKRYYSGSKDNLPYDRFQRKRDFINKSREEDFILRVNFTYPKEN